MRIVETQTVAAGEYPQTVRVRHHTFAADEAVEGGGTDTAPNPHDYFDASLAACKALTAMWYAKRKGFPLERVETRVESDNTEERRGIYRYKVHVEFHGALTDEQRAALRRAADACPITKLMTKAEITIENV